MTSPFSPNGSDRDGRGGRDGDRKGPSWQRVAVWIVVGAIALYLIGSGAVGLLTGGS